jgi:hypothetical protein
LAFHQQAADQLVGDLLGGAGEEGLGEVLGGIDGYRSGYRKTKLSIPGLSNRSAPKGKVRRGKTLLVKHKIIYFLNIILL